MTYVITGLAVAIVCLFAAVCIIIGWELHDHQPPRAEPSDPPPPIRPLAVARPFPTIPQHVIAGHDPSVYGAQTEHEIRVLMAQADSYIGRLQ